METNKAQKPRTETSDEQVPRTLVRSVHLQRTVKYIFVQESELTVIAAFNALTTVFSSMGLGMISFAIGIIVDYSINGDHQRVNGTQMVYVISTLCAILSIVCFGISGWSWHKRKSSIDDLKRDFTEQ